MSKKDKLLNRLCAKPCPTDFRWDDLLTVMRWAGFKEQCRGGSHYMFEHKAKRCRVRISKTHPSGILKEYQILHAIDALTQVGILGDDK